MIRVNVSIIRYRFVVILADFNYYVRGGTKEGLFGYNSR